MLLKTRPVARFNSVCYLCVLHIIATVSWCEMSCLANITFNLFRCAANYIYHTCVNFSVTNSTHQSLLTQTVAYIDT